MARFIKFTNFIAAVAMVAAATSPALAQATYPTGGTYPAQIPATVPLQCNSGGAACAPISATNPGVVQGDAPSGGADTGNPVKVGGKYNSTLPTIVNGQRGDLQISQAAMLRIAIGESSALTDGVNAMTLFKAENGVGFLGATLGFVNNGAGNTFMSRGDANGTVVQYGLGQCNFTSGVTGILSNTAVAVTVQAA